MTSAPDAAQGGFPHHWQAAVLKQRPLILPRLRYVYPREAEEVERGALELLVQPENGEPFLATCALGFADPLAPTGIWSCPNPAQLCAVAGGYAYLIDTTDPARFEQVAFRPVLSVYSVRTDGLALLLFIGNQMILAYGEGGKAWESPRLSDEGIEVALLEDSLLHGRGWELLTDRDTSFALDLRLGTLTSLR